MVWAHPLILIYWACEQLTVYIPVAEQSHCFHTWTCLQMVSYIVDL